MIGGETPRVDSHLGLVEHAPVVAGLPESIRSDFEPPRSPTRFTGIEPLQASDGSWYVLSPQGWPMPVEVAEVRNLGASRPARHIILGEIPGRWPGSGRDR